ncbi:MAG TPA: NADH-quinone oxidoreductase subunit M, partial [Thiolinea sp.]|nr:NADH-quinone oxidoreductase subunit M [Thiolinea sp.]
SFLISLPLYFGYDAAAGTMQFTENLKWLDSLGIHVNYDLGVDGVSIALILLNTFMTVLVLASAWESVKERIAQYMAAFLIMEGLVNGVFMARDAMLFYIFFEGMLLPLFMILGVWGGPQRVHATIKYFIYTFAGSVFLLVSLVYLYTQTSNGSFFLPDLYALTNLSEHAQMLVFFSFLVAFGVKVPIWPLHTWLPEAYSQAPTGGSVMLAAISVKVGGYAFYRLAMPIVPEASHDWALLVVILSLVAIVYMSLVALVQTNLKKLVAYSSVAHMGFVTLGLFLVFKLQGLAFADANLSGSVLAVQGAMVQMISHGFVAGALFLAVGMLAERMNTTEINAYSGITSRMPVFAAF